MTAALREVGAVADRASRHAAAPLATVQGRGGIARVVADIAGITLAAAAPILAGLRPLTTGAPAILQVGAAAAMSGVWLAALTALSRRHALGLEPRRARLGEVAASAAATLAVASTTAFLAGLPLAPPFLAAMAATGVATVGLGRAVAVRRPAVSRVLLVGSRTTVESLTKRMARLPDVTVVGALLEPGTLLPHRVGDVTVLGTSRDAARVVRDLDIDIVAVTGAGHHSAEELRGLVWSLEHTRARVVLPVDLPHITLSRLSLTGGPVPAVGVRHASFRGPRYVVKGLFDRVVAALLVAVLSPFLFLAAVAVKATSRGPVLFRQVRVGRDGERFEMLKFRSMVENAEAMLGQVQGEADRGNVVMFKMKNDPRVTPVGRVLRRWSIDELPQLFNVIRGEMSLVGPRPALPHEVEKYEREALRRLKVKPGITGLWQVSGRSNLSWEDTVHLDLTYAENWSLPGDLGILARTARAVVSSTGAY